MNVLQMVQTYSLKM